MLDLYDLLRTTLDDAFYYFQTAWHMAGGNFSTFDGGITRTNGYHPLWMFLIVPFYWMFDKVWLLLAFLVCMFSLAAGHLAKFAQSVLTVHPRFGLYGWYFVPAYLMKALAVPTLCYVALYLIRRFLGPGPGSGARRAYRDPQAWIFLAGMFFLFVKADFGRPYRYVDSTIEAVQGSNPHIHFYFGTMVMNRLLPEGSVVGSWNAGIIGYFSRFPVVNLDGLINSYGWLQAHKEGIVATFLTRFGLSHMAEINPYEALGRLLLFRECVD